MTIERFFKKIKRSEAQSTPSNPTTATASEISRNENISRDNESSQSPNPIPIPNTFDDGRTTINFDPNSEHNKRIALENLPADPGLRVAMSDYNTNDRDEIRRAFLLRGPCQPRGHNFPQHYIKPKLRRFKASWFDEHPNWLEYSVEKDAAFCLCCYLFRPKNESPFVGEGFRYWKNKKALHDHVGGINSPHNIARRSCEDLLNQKQSITTVWHDHTDLKKYQYQKRLEASIDCVRFLLRQGLPFRGHDESEESKNRGNFIELLKWLGDNNEGIKAIILDNAPGNEKMIAPDIQKDIANAISFEIISSITKEIGDGLFSILVDESRDISSKEQMAIVLRYVKDGCVIERFVGIEHVSSTTALSLKASIDDFFSRHGLSISKVRGQGYDGASNMQGEYNGLKTLILKENSSAYSVHCFAHQLQLAVVAVAKKHTYVEDLFLLVTNIVTMVGGSAKRQDMIREKQAALVYEAIDKGELSTGQGLNQETSLKRAGDTRWSSHQNTLISMTNLFSAVVDVLDTLAHDSDKKFEARVLRDSIQTYNFVFSLHLMKNIMGITADLSQALQRKDQDIVNAMKLVTICKQRLQKMREDGWESLLLQVSSFCEKHEIEVLNMEDMFCFPGKSKRLAPHITNLHHYRVEFFYEVIDMQLLELNYRFSETATELLLCVASLNPIDSFSAFDKQKLVRLAQLYPNDFTAVEVGILEDQLETYIMDMRSSDEFLGLKSIGDLAKRMVEKKKR